MVESTAQSGRMRTLIHPGQILGIHVIEIGCGRDVPEHKEEAIPPTSSHAESPGKRPWDRL